MNCVHRAATLNNHGASLLASGNGREAFDAFRESLMILKKLSQDCANDLCGPPQSKFINPSTTGSPSSKDMFIESAATVSILSDENFYLYGYPLIFSPPSDVQFSSATFSFYGAVALFNVALTTQWNARMNPTNGSVSMQRAMKLYDVCYQVIHDILRNHKSVESLESHHFLMLVALNNYSVLQFNFANYRESQQKFAFVMHLTNSVALSPNHISSQEVEDIILNGLSTRQASAAPCA